MVNEEKLRVDVIRVARRLAEQGLARATDGNISTRLDSDRLLITSSGLYKAWMEVDDLVIIDMEGNLLSGNPGRHPSSEMRLHLEAYRQREDITAVVHAHPPYATALTVAGLQFPLDIMPEVLAALGEVPVAEYATPGTDELAGSIRYLIQTRNAVLLSHHGSLTVGKTLHEALVNLERLEYAAQVAYLARTMGDILPLPEDELTRLRQIYAQTVENKI